MRAAAILGAIVVALALQTTLAEVLLGDGAADFVLVVVVFVALIFGPVPGLLTGAVGGLAQDCLSATGVMAVSPTGAVTVAAGIVGIGGLAKTVVGFATGTLATHVIVTGFGPRFVVFVLASVAHALMVFGLLLLLDLRVLGLPAALIGVQALVNGVAGGLAFEVRQAWPGWLERRRRRRQSLGRRL